MLLTFLFACGGGPTVATTPLHEAPLVEPWAGWGLPVAEGRVVWSDPGSLTVSYEGDRVAALSPGWRTAVRAAGFAEDLDTSAPGLTSVRYLSGERALDLSIVEAGDVTTVTVTLLDPP
jgi:hypothetical protein